MVYDDIHAQIFDTALRLIDLSKKLDSNPDKTKEGVVMVYALGDITDLHVREVGKILPDRLMDYHRFAREKPFRTYADWLANPREWASSSETRDIRDHKKQYSGAVLSSRGVGLQVDLFSASGHREPVDEAFSLLMLNGFCLRPVQPSLVIAASDNQVYKEFARKAKEKRIVERVLL